MVWWSYHVIFFLSFFAGFILFNYFSIFSQLTDFQQAKGRGLCLIDFGSAIDIQAFPEGTMFSGSSETEFLCTQMLEGRPWKWQARLNPNLVMMLATL